MSMYFFPTPYDDELLYSVLARYSIQSGNNKEIHNFDDMFATRNVIASAELPGNLNVLISNMPLNAPYTADGFIIKHSLFPFLASFVPEKRAKDVIQNMKAGDVANIYNRLGLTASNILNNRYFRFCPRCVQEDIKEFGETYWHRIHQITGVFVCPKHEELIYDSTVLMRGKNRQSYIPATKKNCFIKRVNTFSDDTFKKLLWIAKDIEQILSKPFTFQSIQKHKYIYMEKLIEKGFANLNTMVHQKRLRQALNEFWGEEVLHLLQSPIIVNRDCLWLSNLVRDNEISTQPIRHLLLLRMLDIHITDILDNQLYSGIEKGHKEQWEDKLIQLSKEKLSIREMAVVLDSTPVTVRKHIDRLGIEPFWKYNGGGRYVHKAYKDTNEFQRRRRNARKKWLDLMQMNLHLSRNNLRKLDEGVYTWLVKHDKKWLYDNSPTVKNHYSSLDWNERDEELLPKVQKIVKDMKKGVPERVSWAIIGGKLGINGWFSKRKDKMPKVRNYLEPVEETLQDFQVRKIKWAIEELEREGSSIFKWKVLEKAGVKTRYVGDIKDRVSHILMGKGYDKDLLD